MPEPVLVVDDDPFILGMLTHVGRARGLDVVGVRTQAEATDALDARSFGVAVVDLRTASESGLEIIRQVRARDPSTESIVISEDSRLSSALESYAHDVFAFVPKPFDPAQLFATVDRALERRRGALERRRLTWELALLNEVAEIVASSLELDAVLQRATERLAAAFQADFALVRLLPITGGAPVIVAAVGLPRGAVQAGCDEAPGLWPTDRVMADGAPVRIDDASGEPYASTKIYADHPWRSSVTVPLHSGNEILGALTLASLLAARFTAADESVLRTVGKQFAVAAANAQLYQRVHRAKVEWERTFDAISDPIAVFDGWGKTMRTNAALAHLRGWKITQTQGRTCAEVGFCDGGCPNCCVGLAARENRRIRARDYDRRRPHLRRDHAAGSRERRGGRPVREGSDRGAPARAAAARAQPGAAARRTPSWSRRSIGCARRRPSWCSPRSSPRLVSWSPVWRTSSITRSRASSGTPSWCTKSWPGVPSWRIACKG